MAVELPLLGWSFPATLTLAAKQFYAVKQDTSNPGNVVIVAAATDKACGILQDTPAVGKVGNVMLMGISKFVAKGTIHVGSKLGLGSDGDGRLAAIVAGTDTTIYIVGESLNECADGDIGYAAICFPNSSRAA